MWNGADSDLSTSNLPGQEDASWNMPQVEMNLTEIMDGPDSPEGKAGWQDPSSQQVTGPW